MMEGIYHEQPLMNRWGNSGPYFDYRGLDQAPYRSLYQPTQLPDCFVQDLHPLPQEGMGDLPDDTDILDDGLSSEDEEELEDEDGLKMYSHVDLHKMLGQQAAVWCHRTPDTLAIFTPIPGDTLATVVGFARSSLQCDPAVDRVLLLTPGHSRPLDPATFHRAKEGSAILLVPRYDYVVSVEVPQLKVKLQMIVKVTMAVRNVKATLQRHHGFPIDRTDLLFRDQPMENQRHLFDYRITHGATIFVMLHLIYDVCIKVETFWGQNYELYVDACMTTGGLLNAVLRRTISPQAGDVASYFHLTLPRHALVMYSGDGRSMKWMDCLGLYGLQEGCTFSLATVALAHNINIQTIPVFLDSQKSHKFFISKFDYWSVLALKLHGVLGYPINLMRLIQGQRQLDLARAVGAFSHKSAPVHLDLSLVHLDDDVCHGVHLTFRLGGGLEEVLKCSPSRTVKSVKGLLEEIGVPNATAYDFFVDGYRLPNHIRIKEAVEEYKKPIDLKLRHYPVLVHGPKSTIYEMRAHNQEALKVFKTRLQLKTGLSANDYYMLMAGMPITDSDDSQIFHTPLGIRSSVFLMGVQHSHILFVVWDDWLVKLRLPFHPQPSEIKDKLWKDRHIPEGSLASLGNFLQWFFAMRANSKDIFSDKMADETKGHNRVKNKRSRCRDQWETVLWRYNGKQMKRLEKVLEIRQQQKQQYRKKQHYQQQPRKQRTVQLKLAQTGTGDRDKSGVWYAAHTQGQWQRVNPEDLVDNYLRSWSLPPDPAHTLHAHRSARRCKHLSAVPDLCRKRGQGQAPRSEPQWVHSLHKMAQQKIVEPSMHTGLTNVKPKRKHCTHRI